MSDSGSSWFFRELFGGKPKGPEQIGLELCEPQQAMEDEHD
jgi:hypothetical protein